MTKVDLDLQLKAAMTASTKAPLSRAIVAADPLMSCVHRPSMLIPESERNSRIHLRIVSRVAGLSVCIDRMRYLFEGSLSSFILDLYS